MALFSQLNQMLNMPFKKRRVSKQSEVATSPVYVIASWLSSDYLYNTRSYLNTYRHRVFQQMVNANGNAKTAVALKRLSVLADGWQITNEDTNEGGQARQGDFVRDTLNALPDGLEPVLEHSLEAMKFGYSLAEKVYEPIKMGPWAGLLGYKVIRDKPVYNFRINVTDKGEIQGFTQQQDDVDGIQIPKWKMVYYGYQSSSDNPYGISDLCPAFSHVFAQTVIDESWTSALQRYAMPILVGVAQDQNVDEDTRKKLQKELKKLREERGILLDDDLKEVKLLEQSTSNQGYTAYERHQMYRGSQIRQACMVPELLMGEGQRVGSKAMNQGHMKVFVKLVIRHVRQEHARVVNKQIIEPLVDMNFEHVVKYPLFSYGPSDSEDEDMLANIITKYITAGVIDLELPGEKEWIRERHNFPAIASLAKSESKQMMKPTPPDPEEAEEDMDE